MDRGAPIPVAKLRNAQNNARDLADSLIPETLDKCTANAPDLEDGLTQDEKFLAISRLEVSGRTRSSQTEQIHHVVTKDNLKIKMRYGWVCQCGFYPDDLSKKNQDNLLVAADMGDKNPNCSLFGVFDGHGKFGTECSTFAVDKLYEFMSNDKKLQSDPERVFHESLVKVNAEMHKQKKRRANASFFDDNLAGTTAICVLVQGDELIVANVGDSRAIIATDVGGRLESEALSADQTPYRKDERDRCKKAGAVVMTMDQIEGYKPYDPNCDSWGEEDDDDGGDPPRLWLPNKGCPGVAFTRSLGDGMAETIGCFAEPEIHRRKILPTDQFVVIASDGVFEFITSQTVVDIVSNFDNAYDASRALVTEAYKLWLHYEVRTDDITVIVIFLDHPEGGVALSPAAFKKAATLRDVGTANILEAQIRPVRRDMSRKKRVLIEAATVELEEIQEVEEEERPPKSTEEAYRIRQAISSNFLFQHLSPTQFDLVINTFDRVDVKAGETIITQGEPGDKFYVVGSGVFDCYLNPEGDQRGERKLVHTYDAKEGGMGNPSFGELALMYSKPRAATVVARSDGYLWALGRQTFRRMLIRKPNQELIKALKKVDILSSLGRAQMQRLADTLKEVTFEDNELIIRQGDVGETMYLIKEGAVYCTLNDAVTEACANLDETPQEDKFRSMRFKEAQELVTPRQESRQPHPPKGVTIPDFDAHASREVLKISAGGYFGEKALIQAAPRAASVISRGKSTCFMISRKTFEEVLGPLSAIIQKVTKKRETESLAALQMKSNAKEIGLEKASITDLKVQCVIAQSENCVYRVAKGQNGKNFTLKSYNRENIEKASLQAQVLRDRQLLALAMASTDPECTQFTLPVIKTFVGEGGLHVAFKGIGCGPLIEFMSSPFCEDTTKFVVASVVLLLESLHSRGIMCRSVNPQQLMLDDRGYVKLADLGFSKYMEDNSLRTFTMCGDTGYLAPEQVVNNGYGMQADFWAMGILTYEMLSGTLPFLDTEEIFSQISKFNSEQIKFPPETGAAVQQLVKSLLCADPSTRLTSFENIKANPWFQGFDWGKLQTGSMVSPLEDAAKQASADLLATSQAKAVDSPPTNSSSDSWYENF